LSIVCNPGDAVYVIVNYSWIIPNCGFEKRVTVNFGFHKRSSVLGVKGGGVHSEAQVFDEEIIQRRSKTIGYAIEARKAKYKDETPYSYKPFKDANIDYVWNYSSRNDLKDYNLEDLSI